MVSGVEDERVLRCGWSAGLVFPFLLFHGLCLIANKPAVCSDRMGYWTWPYRGAEVSCGHSKGSVAFWRITRIHHGWLDEHDPLARCARAHSARSRNHTEALLVKAGTIWKLSLCATVSPLSHSVAVVLVMGVNLLWVQRLVGKGGWRKGGGFGWRA